MNLSFESQTKDTLTEPRRGILRELGPVEKAATCIVDFKWYIDKIPLRKDQAKILWQGADNLLGLLRLITDKPK
jgi:hypothetical protein